MKRQAVIIGLGQFGLPLAQALTERDVEVLAIDDRPERVRAAAPLVAEALCFDATDLEALARTAPERREVCICAIGDESKEASIITTALLRQLGAPRIIARANDAVHARILALVGAHKVVNPEREFGVHFASQILHEGVLGEMPLGEDLLLSEIHVPASMRGHTLAELALPSKFGVIVVATRGGERGAIEMPRPDQRINEGDVLVVVGRNGAVEKMMERS